MPNSNSSTSLYSFTNTVRVSANNFTTLYNATPSNVDVASVSDRNFTTLYNKQSEINPTRPYGNANVEAFLNIGHDQGGNVVENINANGNISGNVIIARTEANLGLVGNVYIGGGGLNYFLTTDGSGGLAWEPPIIQYGNAIPFINFNVTANANNQTFSNTLLSAYTSNVVMNVMKNGVNIEPDLYTVSGNILTVNIPLTVGDSIDVLSTQASNAGAPGGAEYAVQINNGTGGFYGDAANFSFQPSGSFGGQYAVTARHLSVTGNIIANNNITAANISVTGNSNVGNLNVGGVANLGPVSNVRIFGGSANYLLQTDGLGVLSWIDPSVTTPTSLNATIANVHISGGLNGYVLQTDGTGNLTWTAQTGGGGGNGVPGGSNTQVQYNNAGNFAGDSTFTFNSTTKVLTANYITAANSINVTNSGGFPTSGSNATDSMTLVSTGGYNTAIGRNGTSMWFSVPTGSNYNWYINGSGAATLDASGFTSNTAIQAPNIGTSSSNIAGNGASLFSIPGTAIVTEVANANYASYAGNAFSVAGANVSGSVALATLANTANVANTVDGPNVTNSVSQSNYANVANSVAVANVVGLGNIATINLTGSTTNVLYANGVFAALPTTSDANYANFAGNVTIAAQPNITSLGTLTNLSVSGNANVGDMTATGNVSIQRAFEKITPNATGATGTINFDVLTQSIIYNTANATANFTLNIRGNNTTTLDTILPTNQDVTIVYLNTVGTTAYIANTIQIDGNTVTPKYVGGTGPNSGVRLTSAVQSYTYTIIKTAGNTYSVLGSLTEYK